MDIKLRAFTMLRGGVKTLEWRRNFFFLTQNKIPRGEPSRFGSTFASLKRGWIAIDLSLMKLHRRKWRGINPSYTIKKALNRLPAKCLIYQVGREGFEP